jgi:hypothetical protein
MNGFRPCRRSVASSEPCEGLVAVDHLAGAVDKADADRRLAEERRDRAVAEHRRGDHGGDAAALGHLRADAPQRHHALAGLPVAVGHAEPLLQHDAVVGQQLLEPARDQQAQQRGCPVGAQHFAEAGVVAARPAVLAEQADRHRQRVEQRLAGRAVGLQPGQPRVAVLHLRAQCRQFGLARCRDRRGATAAPKDGNGRGGADCRGRPADEFDWRLHSRPASLNAPCAGPSGGRYS